MLRWCSRSGSKPAAVGSRGGSGGIASDSLPFGCHPMDDAGIETLPGRRIGARPARAAPGEAAENQMQRRIPQIGIVMNSDKDLPHMQRAAEFLHVLGIPFEMTVLSPYRTLDRVRDFGTSAISRGYEVIIAGAGGTNELACMIASYTTLPVIGVPLRAAGEAASISKELAS